MPLALKYPSNCGCIECKLGLHHWQTDFKKCCTMHARGRGRRSKSHHLLCCQMLMCQDQCPHCPMFQAGGQSGFGTSLTQLVFATPCQQTELMYIGETGKWQQRSTSTHAEFSVYSFFFHSRFPTYPQVWIQYISVRLSFHTRQCHLINEGGGCYIIM